MPKRAIAEIDDAEAVVSPAKEVRADPKPDENAGADKPKRKPRAKAKAKRAEGEPPKCPRLIKIVHSEIMEHPDYTTKLDGSVRWAFEMGCVGMGSFCDKENNKWSRIIWAHLFLDGPAP